MTARASLGSLLPARENQRLPIRSAARAAFLLFAAVLVLLVGPAVPVHASLPTSRSSAFGRPAPLDAPAGLTRASLGASLNVAGDESATVQLAHEASRFSFAASLCLPALALAPLEPAALELQLASQSLSAPVQEAESSRPGLSIYRGWECGCERAYALNNPLKYVDPDGREVRVPESMRKAVQAHRDASPEFSRVYERLDADRRVLVTFTLQAKPKSGSRIDTSIVVRRSPSDMSLQRVDARVNVPVGTANKAPEMGHELIHVEEVLESGKTLAERMDSGEKGIRKGTSGYESEHALDKERQIKEEVSGKPKKDPKEKDEQPKDDSKEESK